MLQWRGKRPFTSTSYFPAQEKEQHGEEVDGWLNKIFNPHANRRTELARFGTACHRCSHLLRKLGFASADMTPCASLGGRGPLTRRRRLCYRSNCSRGSDSR